jgi:hypothetical protein
LYIKNKADQYTNGTASFTHKELILLATNKNNLLVQTGEWGAKTLTEEKIVAMQAELTALNVNSLWAPNLGPQLTKMVPRRMMRKKVTRVARRRIRKTLQTNVSRRKMRNGNVCPPRTVNHTRRNSRITLSIGASIICAGAVTKKRNVRKARNARLLSKTTAVLLTGPPLHLQQS